MTTHESGFRKTLRWRHAMPLGMFSDGRVGFSTVRYECDLCAWSMLFADQAPATVEQMLRQHFESHEPYEWIGLLRQHEAEQWRLRQALEDCAGEAYLGVLAADEEDTTLGDSHAACQRVVIVVHDTLAKDGLERT